MREARSSSRCSDRAGPYPSVVAGPRECDRSAPIQQLTSMGTIAGALDVASSVSEVTVRHRSARSALSDFERVYRENVAVVTAFFARRCGNPQTVADLTSETVVRAAAGFSGFDPRRGEPRAWLYGIARNVYAQHCADVAGGRDTVARLAGLVELPKEEIDELAERIDAERRGRVLLDSLSALSPSERVAVELVDIDGLTPKEAAVVLGVARGVLRMRLLRARARLRKGHERDEQI
jgi:RNA polymerase sigma factor (sigma-70 family)